MCSLTFCSNLILWKVKLQLLFLAVFVEYMLVFGNFMVEHTVGPAIREVPESAIAAQPPEQNPELTDVQTSITPS